MLGVKFLSNSIVRLRSEGCAALELLPGNSARFRAQNKQLFRNIHHLSSALQLVIGNLNGEFT